MIELAERRRRICYSANCRRVEVAARIELVGRSKIEAFRLINEITEAVENRRAFVEFDAAQLMRTMTDNQLSAGVHSIVRELPQEARGFVAVVRGLMAVDRQDDQFRLTTGLAHHRQDTVLLGGPQCEIDVRGV